MLLLADGLRSEEVKYIWPGLNVPSILIPFERQAGLRLSVKIRIRLFETKNRRKKEGRANELHKVFSNVGKARYGIVLLFHLTSFANGGERLIFFFVFFMRIFLIVVFFFFFFFVIGIKNKKRTAASRLFFVRINLLVDRENVSFFFHCFFFFLFVFLIPYS